MKNYLKILMIVIVGFLGTSSVFGATILFPTGGGTGIGSAVSGDINKCLKVSNNSPFTYTLGTCNPTIFGQDWNLTTNVYGQSSLAPTTTQNIIVSGTGTSTMAGNLEIAGNLKVSGALFTPISIYSSGTVTAGNFVANNASATSTLAGGLAIETSGLVYDYSTNNVGIGTTAPQSALDVNGVLTLSNTGTDKKIQFQRTGGDTWSIEHDNNQIYFYDGSAAALTLQNDRDVIVNSGNVGIGTASPAGNLHISSGAPFFKLEATTGTNYVQQDFTNTSGSLRLGLENSSGGGLLTGTSAYAGIFGHTGAYPLQFSTNNNVRMTINSSGNVGIGTTSPNAKLNVEGGNLLVNSNVVSVAPGGGLRIVAPIASTHYNWMLGAQQNISATFEITPSTAVGGTTFSTPTAVFTAGGNVGIGTTGPSGRLDVYSAVSGVTKTLNVRNAENSGTMYGIYSLADGAGGTTHVGGYFSASGATNNYGLIVESGNVGVGTTAPVAKLEVVDTNPLKLSRSGNNSFTSAISGLMSGSGAGDLIWDTAQADGGFAWRVNNGNTLALGITEAGNVGIGTSTPLGKLQVSSGASATTTVSFGEIGNSSSKSCFNTKNNTGSDISFYFVGTSMVVENNLCK